MITPSFRASLLGDGTSRINKIHLAIAWAHFYGWHIVWKWKGEPPELPYGQMRSRLLFQFEPDGPFEQARSFDEDVVPTLQTTVSVKCR